MTETDAQMMHDALIAESQSSWVPSGVMTAQLSTPEGPATPTARKWLRSADREVVRPNEGYGFRWAKHGFPDPKVPKWSYHPEYELHLIRYGEGRYIVGDKVGLFGPGSVWLIGPNLPHDWVSFVERGEYLPDRDAIVQFSDEWIASCAVAMPPIDLVRSRLQQSRRGLLFVGATAKKLQRTLDDMGDLAGIARLASMLQILDVIARAPDGDAVELDASYARPAESSKKALSTVDIGLDYILQNLGGEVTLQTAAALANMSESAFSRYFRKASGLTFTEMTTKLRISQACRLLSTTEAPIAGIAQSVGYANLSNFNRQFKRSMGCTPREYRKLGLGDPVTYETIR